MPSTEKTSNTNHPSHPDETARGPVSSGYWHELTMPDIARLDPERTVTILPVSATEQHGAHLPLNTDAIINAGIVERVLQAPPVNATVLVLPALPIGDSIEHTDYPGTLSARLRTVIDLWLDVGSSVARAGVRKMVIFNTHGGQRGHVDQVAVRLRARHRMMVARANAGNFGKPDGLFSDAERAHGLHGGAIETAMMLYLRPDLVRSELAREAPSAAIAMQDNQFLGMERGVGLGWMAQDLNASGICGDPTTASVDSGRALVEHMSRSLARVCIELANTPLDMLKGADKAQREP